MIVSAQGSQYWLQVNPRIIPSGVPWQWVIPISNSKLGIAAHLSTWDSDSFDNLLPALALPMIISTVTSCCT